MVKIFSSFMVFPIFAGFSLFQTLRILSRRKFSLHRPSAIELIREMNLSFFYYNVFNSGSPH
jgi:hypothetical protein